MKLPAFLILLTILACPSRAIENSSARAIPSPLSSPSASNLASPQDTASDARFTGTPRQLAERKADLLNARRDYVAAVQAYDDILKDDPRNAAVLNKAGVACQSMGNGERAERYYRRALRVDKNFAIALNNFGTVEYAAARYGQAIKYYRKAIDRDNKRATVFSNLGYAYAANHQYEKALDAFGKALAVDPKFYSHHGGNGPLLEERSAADSGTLFFLLAKSYAKIGDVEHTVQYLRLAVDGGYKNFAAAAKDAAFAPVIENAHVREALHLPPLVLPDAGGGKTPS
jgi:tetratricopeptide (TPR) repeat protein